MHDVEDDVSFDVTMPALIEIEDDASVATLFQKVLNLGVGGFKNTRSDIRRADEVLGTSRGKLLALVRRGSSRSRSRRGWSR
jgi:hypothetical protein